MNEWLKTYEFPPWQWVFEGMYVVQTIRRRTSKIEKLCKLNILDGGNGGVVHSKFIKHLNAKDFYANCKSQKVIKVFLSTKFI